MMYNPLDLPWGERLPKEVKQEEAKEKGQPPFLGIRTEQTESATGPSAITFQVSGLSGIPSGEYKTTYNEGCTLASYLRALGMGGILRRAAARDMGNLEKGKCRGYYVPGPGAKILISPSNYSPAMHLQRSSGARSNKTAPKEVNVSLEYGNQPQDDVDQI